MYFTHNSDSNQLPIDSSNEYKRVSPSPYGKYNTMAFQCFNTNSKRCSFPLFFQRETPETSRGLHWCINQRFVNHILHLALISHCHHYYKTHTTCIEFLCLSTNLKRKKKEEIKYAWHCAFCKETTEMGCCIVLRWPLHVGRGEKPT